MARAGPGRVAVVAPAIVHAAERVLPLVPGRFVWPMAQALGSIAYAASPDARAAVRENLAVVAPGRNATALARHIFAEQSRNYLDIFRLVRMNAASLRTGVEKWGWERFLEAHAEGKGVIVASAHLGPISVVGQILVAHGFETVLPIEIERSEIQRAVNRARATIGLQLIPTDSPFGVVRALRQGKVFGILADRAVTGVGERVQFFGREALLPSAHIALGLRTGAPVIPAFSLRDKGKLVATFEPRLPLVPSGDRHTDVREGVARWARVLETYVTRHPEQWTVFERMWEHR